MGQPYVGEIRIFGGNFAPAGWAFCEGQLLPISENETLFNLIGTTYGGDGEMTFALPNLASRFPVHQGTGPSGQRYTLAEMGGAESVTLTVNQMPGHSHRAVADPTATSATPTTPADSTWAGYPDRPFAAPGTPAAMHPNALSFTGGSQPHENMPPYLGVNFIISLFGTFPSQN